MTIVIPGGPLPWFAHTRTDLSPQGRVRRLDERDDVAGILRILESSGHRTDVEAMHHEMEEAGFCRIGGVDLLHTRTSQLFAPGETAFQAAATPIQTQKEKM